MEEFNGYLYIGTLNVNLSLEPSAGTEVWRSDTGAAGTWQQSNQDGFGGVSPENNFLTFAMVVFKGELYATVYNWSEETEDSIQLWKTADGQSWSQVATSGLGTGQGATDSLFMPMVINGVFYMGNDQASGAASLYSSSDGANWQDTNHEGSADANNYGLYAMTLFSNYMYSGFSNESGAQIWRAGPINPLAINTSSLPPAVLGNDYTATIDVASGTTPYTCSYSGDLPPGLTLSSSCVISGAPTHASDHTFTLSVRDSGTPYQTASKSLTISVSPGLPETGTGGIPRPVYSKPLLDLTYFYAMLAQKD